MEVLILRHAIAEERAGASGRDADRRLTREGRQKFRRGARALATLVPELTLVLTSPFRRALETAEILAEALPTRPPVHELAPLAPGHGAAEVVAALGALQGHTAVAVVGHEPSLSRLEGLLLTGDERSLAELRKGGAALVELSAAPAAGGGTLRWHLTPAQLRELGG